MIIHCSASLRLSTDPRADHHQILIENWLLLWTWHNISFSHKKCGAEFNGTERKMETRVWKNETTQGSIKYLSVLDVGQFSPIFVGFATTKLISNMFGYLIDLADNRIWWANFSCERAQQFDRSATFSFPRSKNRFIKYLWAISRKRLKSVGSLWALNVLSIREKTVLIVVSLLLSFALLQSLDAFALLSFTIYIAKRYLSHHSDIECSCYMVSFINALIEWWR